jgi:hypothetical protein
MNTENFVGKHIKARVYFCPGDNVYYTAACKVLSQTPTSLVVFVEDDWYTRIPKAILGKTKTIAYKDFVCMLSHFPKYTVGQEIHWRKGGDFFDSVGVITEVKMSTASCFYAVRCKLGDIYRVPGERITYAVPLLEKHKIFSKNDYEKWREVHHPDKCGSSTENVELYRTIKAAVKSRFH